MQTYNFNWSGKAITVQIDKDTDHKFFYTENGVIKEFVFKGFSSNYKVRTIQVDWVAIIKDNANNELMSSAADYLQADLDQYDMFYNLNVMPEAAGDFYAKHSINGIMQRILGCKCFNAAGVFQAP